MRMSDLVTPKTSIAESHIAQPTATVQRLLETRDESFSKPMTGKELMEWVNRL